MPLHEAHTDLSPQVRRALRALRAMLDAAFAGGGRALRVGYVEALGTADGWRQRGHGTTVMRRLGELIATRHELGVLSTGAHPFHAHLGRIAWQGATWVDAPGGRTRTPDDDDSIMILRTPASPHVALTDDLVADWRPGDVW